MLTISTPTVLWPSVKVVALALFVNLLAGSALSGPANAEEPPVKIVAFGDSLTAGYLLPPQDAFPAQLGRALAAKGTAVEMTNAGVSGDTTAAGLQRFDWAIPEGTEAVILELGANDALRGMPPADARANLDTIISRLKARNIEVLLTGMKAPKNWGEDYARQFDAIFPELAEAHGLLLYPFFLDGIALDPALNLDDGLHPNGRGVATIVTRILPKVEELIGRVKAKRQPSLSKS